MGRDVLYFGEIDGTQVPLVGGKGAHLGELSRIDGVRVPLGFCVTADAFRRVVVAAPTIDDQLERLSRLGPGEPEAIRAQSAEIRRRIEGIAIPDDLVAMITGVLGRLGEQAAWAVRSSATAEDLPTASFAGQHDSYLNVVGRAAILRDISRCWASLFTERAVTYRLQNGFDERTVAMAVVVQRMVFPQVAGILFTADPVSGNRKVASVESVLGLGEALVSGLVGPDIYMVRDGAVVSRTIGVKRLAIDAVPGGGTRERAVDPERQTEPALTDAQVLRLVRLGRRIADRFGGPQDIEWCLVDGQVLVVQSRPITTLYPIPEARDAKNHVYVSVGHGQMMTDAMKPLGISFWQMTTARPMAEAGGRLFVDVTQQLASPTTRAALLEVMGKGDPLVREALETLLERGDFVPSQPDDGHAWTPPGGGAPSAIDTDPSIVTELIERTEASIAAARREIHGKSGTALLDFIMADLDELKRVLFDPQSHRAIMAGIEAAWWLNDQLQAWLGEKNAADTLAQSVSNNVTSEMGLALLDVADAVRPHAQVVAFLESVDDDGFLDELPRLAGGREARDAIRGWLDRYGMRGVGEIDITRPRWSERPTALLPVILGHVKSFGPGKAQRRFERGLKAAEQKKRELLVRLRTLPGGDEKAEETRRMIDRVRTFAGYREYPKYAMVSRYFVYKQALLEEADRLVRAHVLSDRDDIFYLRFEELRDAVCTHHADHELIRQRRDAFTRFERLTPPRVLTSDGEMLAGAYRREAPPGALVGVPVSAGTVDGRARVILDMADANLEAGDILVTAFTDPSWTALFVGIKGLVTEVGGLMTHGAVIAREYGLPAVVGVQGATQLIRDGQRIRVHGAEGYVEILA